jgi:ribulose 1,5-bisphosphate carboxylase large subunit-like protein
MIPFLDYAPAIQMIEVNDLNIHTVLVYMDHFIKTDEKVINMHYIRWIKKFTDCMEVCTKSDGCELFKHTHRVCKETSPAAYHKLNHAFLAA